MNNIKTSIRKKFKYERINKKIINFLLILFVKKNIYKYLGIKMTLILYDNRKNSFSSSLLIIYLFLRIL